MPAWLHPIAIISLAVAALCALVIVVDILAGHRQHMWIMNIVWPLNALYAGPLALWAYYTMGRLSTAERVQRAKERDQEPPNQKKPFWQSVALGAMHCGSGCSLGDICAEWLLFFIPVIATWFGWQTLFENKIFSAWIVDYIFAFLFGVAFQYFTIVPMRNLSVGEGLVTAVKADTASLTAWQIGMYGWMAIAHFAIFGALFNQALAVNSVEFWFMMQIAMLAGFLTSYPVNWWLLRRGIKEKM